MGEFEKVQNARAFAAVGYIAGGMSWLRCWEDCKGSTFGPEHARSQGAQLGHAFREFEMAIEAGAVHEQIGLILMAARYKRVTL